MAQSLPYPLYMPAPHPQPYMLAPAPMHHHIHHIPSAVQIVPAQSRIEQPIQRKRPKYTRSKTGCLTCRGKKIKCDETKPKCTRCAHGQRECVWPDLPPAKKKSPPSRKNSNGQQRMSPSDSLSHVSDSSHTSRDVTPINRDFGSAVPSLVSERRHSDMSNYSYDLSSSAPSRRSSLADTVPQGPLPQGVTPAVANGMQDLHSPFQSGLSSVYGYAESPNNSSISSRNNSRPSTANSIPSSRLSVGGLEGAHYVNSPAMQGLEARDVSRWNNLTSSHADMQAYSYHPAPENSMVPRPYGHEQGARI